MKKFLPIKVHHVIFGYGIWWGCKVYYWNNNYGFIVIPSSYCVGGMIVVKNGEKTTNGKLKSWQYLKK